MSNDMRESGDRSVPIAAMLALLVTSMTNGAIRQDAPVRAEPSQEVARVSSDAVSHFFEWLRSNTDVVKVWKEASRVFPRGFSIAGYPDTFQGRLPRQPNNAVKQIEPQLLKDNLKLEDLEGVTLFKGDNGIVQVDIILVLRKVDKRIVGVYQRWWGR
jgi:hypothetical protein